MPVGLIFFSDLGDTELDFNRENQDRDGNCEEVDLATGDVFSGNEGIPPANPYEEASLPKENSQSLTGVVEDDDGLDEDKLMVKVLLLLDSDEFMFFVFGSPSIVGRCARGRHLNFGGDRKRTLEAHMSFLYRICSHQREPFESNVRSGCKMTHNQWSQVTRLRIVLYNYSDLRLAIKVRD